MLRGAGTALASGGLGAVAGCGGVPGGGSPTDRTPTEPERPAGYAPLGRLPLAGTTEAVVTDDGTTVAVATGDGVATVDVSDPAAPTPLAERTGLLADRPGGPLTGVHDASVAGDRLLAVGPSNPLPEERVPLHAAVLFDVADPADPAVLAVTETDYPIHNATLADDLAYLTGRGPRQPVVILDPTTGDRVGSWSVLDAAPAWGAVDPALRPSHDVTVRGNRAVVAAWDAGTWLLDVSDPAAPRAVGHVGTQSPGALAELSGDAVGVAGTELPGNSHFAMLAREDLLLVGREAWDADGDGEGGPGGIDVYDVGDPAAPVHLATVPPLPTPDPSRDGPWTTAHNVAVDGDRLYASWYHGGVSLHDLSVPSHPVTLARWRDPARAAFWTAVPADGCFVGASTELAAATGAVYTFPDRPGRQTDPPPLSAARQSSATAGAPPDARSR